MLLSLLFNFELFRELLDLPLYDVSIFLHRVILSNISPCNVQLQFVVDSVVHFDGGIVVAQNNVD